MFKTSSLLSEGDECIPSYEESVRESQNQAKGLKSKPKLSLPERIAQSRSQKIKDTLKNYIEPEVETYGFDGIARRTIILVPSDVLPTHAISRENLSTPPPAGVVLVQLKGVEHTGDFWQQPAVIADLNQYLKREFESGIANDSQNHTAASPIDSIKPSIPTKKSWLKRTFSSPDSETDPTGSTGQWNLGWRPDDRKTSVASGAVHASARLKETALRVESELGLFQTETFKCVWVEIEVGT